MPDYSKLQLADGTVAVVQIIALHRREGRTVSALSTGRPIGLPKPASTPLGAGHVGRRSSVCAKWPAIRQALAVPYALNGARRRSPVNNPKRQRFGRTPVGRPDTP